MIITKLNTVNKRVHLVESATMRLISTLVFYYSLKVMAKKGFLWSKLVSSSDSALNL